MDSGKEQNYWPGFVDALSNVVLTLVFVLVIFVFALVMASNKVEKKLQDVIQARKQEQSQQNTPPPPQTTAPEDNTKTGFDENVGVSKDKDEQIILDSEAPKRPNVGPVRVQHTADTITLGFPVSIAEMDEKSAITLTHVIEATIASAGEHKVIMRSYIGKESYSAAQRLAYYRAIGARNILMKAGEKAADISISLVTPLQPEDGRVEITFQKK